MTKKQKETHKHVYLVGSDCPEDWGDFLSSAAVYEDEKSALDDVELNDYVIKLEIISFKQVEGLIPRLKVIDKITFENDEDDEQ